MAKWQITGARQLPFLAVPNPITSSAVCLPAILSSVFSPQLLHNTSNTSEFTFLNT
jgi:hypothetical protein